MKSKFCRHDGSTEKTREKPKRKRRKRKVHADDVRLRYQADYIHALNSGDSVLLMEAMERYHTPDILHIERFIDNIPGVVMYREMRGRDQLFKYTLANWEAMPDLTATLTSRKLCLRTDGTSYIIATALFHGSFLFNIQTNNAQHSSQNLLSRWNPFTKLYNILSGTTSPVSPPPVAAASSSNSKVVMPTSKQSAAAVDPSRSKTSERDFATMQPVASSSNDRSRDSGKKDFDTTESVASSGDDGGELLSKSERGKPNVSIPAINISKDRVQVSTQATTFDTSQKKDRPFRLTVAATMIGHVNKDMKVYRSEIIKRGKISYDFSFLDYPSPPDSSSLNSIS